MGLERRRIFAWGGRAALAALAAAGLALLLAPGAARSLVGAREASSWQPTDEAMIFMPADEPFLEIGFAAPPAAQVEANRQRWAAMKESEREALLERLDHLAQLTAEERSLLAERYGELQKLSEKERQTLRRQAEALARFEASLGRQDLAALEGLEARARAKYLSELWRARQGQR